MSSETHIEHYDDQGFELEISPDLLNSDLGGEEIDEIHYRMTHSSALVCGFNVAFGEYMRMFDHFNPDVFVLTANSAIPVADAIRGWYEVTDKNRPLLTHVYANRDLAKEEEPSMRPIENETCTAVFDIS